MQDLAFAQFPGESHFGAVLAFALIVVPPLLGVVNCVGVWYPILERAELAGPATFAQTVLRAVAQKAALLMPAACLSIALALIPQGMESSITALIITAILTLALAALGSRSTFRGATRVTGGELYDRAHHLAKRAGVKLRNVWILAESTPPNAFAFTGNQIAIAPAFVRQLTSPQVDAVLAHELGHLRHNDFKIPVMVYSGYLAFAAPLLDYLIGR